MCFFVWQAQNSCQSQVQCLTNKYYVHKLGQPCHLINAADSYSSRALRNTRHHGLTSYAIVRTAIAEETLVPQPRYNYLFVLLSTQLFPIPAFPTSLPATAGCAVCACSVAGALCPVATDPFPSDPVPFPATAGSSSLL